MKTYLFFTCNSKKYYQNILDINLWTWLHFSHLTPKDMDVLHCCVWKRKEKVQNPIKQCFPIILNVSTTPLACSVMQTLFYGVRCRTPFFSKFMEYSRALTALILPSIPVCYSDVTLDSPHGRDLIKTCKNIWEVQLPGMQLAKAASQQRNKRNVRSFYEGIQQTW